MAGLVLWGRTTSGNVQKAVWALEELGLPYTRHDVGGKFGGLDTPEFTAMNPNRYIPVLQDGDLTLWESHAVIRYLAARYSAGGLWPEAPEERAMADQWTDWTAATFQPAWISLYVQLVRIAPGKRNPDTVAKAIQGAVACFRMLDDRLALQPFLGGASLTYADIAAGASLYRWSTMDFERPSLPNVEAWHRRLKERPAFVKGVEVDYSDMIARD